jgi:hypothetical protein
MHTNTSSGRIVVKEPVVERPGIYAQPQGQYKQAIIQSSYRVTRRATYSLRHADTQEVEISDARKLEEQLVGYKVPQGIPRGVDIV